jgi:hypothetical protein
MRHQSIGTPPQPDDAGAQCQISSSIMWREPNAAAPMGPISYPQSKALCTAQNPCVRYATPSAQRQNGAFSTAKMHAPNPQLNLFVFRQAFCQRDTITLVHGDCAR